MLAIEKKLMESQIIVENYNNGDEHLKKSLINIVKNRDPNNQYSTNYLDVIDDVKSHYTLQTNLLVAVAEHNLFCNKAQFYNNPLFLKSAIRNQMASYNAKSIELRNFERSFNHADTFEAKMKLYSTFITAYPAYVPFLLSNPFIELKYHEYYNLIVPDELARINY